MLTIITIIISVLIIAGLLEGSIHDASTCMDLPWQYIRLIRCRARQDRLLEGVMYQREGVGYLIIFVFGFKSNQVKRVLLGVFS